MTEDRELLELAAKAVDRKGTYRHWEDSRGYVSYGIALDGRPGSEWWNPLTDDGDALRLAVKLHLTVKNIGTHTIVGADMPGYHSNAVEENLTIDPYAATRRAITRAAAELGKMKGEKES